MEVINVIVLENNCLVGVQSFPIINVEDTDKIVDEAESLFSKLVELNNPQLTEDEIYTCLEDGYYNNLDAYEVLLSWSTDLI